MIPLPKYVRANRKGERVYYSFHRFRSTAKAWPPIQLGCAPLDPLFPARIALCERMDFTGRKLEFIDATGRTRELPSPAEPDAFWKAVERADDIGRRLAAGERKTFAGLIIEYRDSAAYKTLAASSRKEYDRYIDVIEAAWGDEPVASLTAVDAQKAIDAFKDTPASGRYFRSVLSRIVSWGVPRGYRQDNPIDHTEKAGEGGTYSPWPDWAFEVMFEHGRVGLHLPVYSALYTGQRSVDVMKMVRPRQAASEMPILAQKTGKFVPVQIHSEYRAIIEAAAADHVMLHLREDGAPWTLGAFRTAWQRNMASKAFERMRAHRIVFHGLRKNAVIMLLEAGCSEAEVGAIVGMSEAMVRHYSLEISARRLAVNAMKKLEAGWGDIRRNLFGAAGVSR